MACGRESPELSTPCSDMASKLLTLTLTFTAPATSIHRYLTPPREGGSWANADVHMACNSFTLTFPCTLVVVLPGAGTAGSRRQDEVAGDPGGCHGQQAEGAACAGMVLQEFIQPCTWAHSRQHALGDLNSHGRIENKTKQIRHHARPRRASATAPLRTGADTTLAVC